MNPLTKTMGRRILASMLVLMGFNPPLMAQLIVSDIELRVGHHTLLPNTSDQQLEIFVTGTAAVSGINFHFAVGDGFPDLPGSSQDGPNITSIDLVGNLSPTLFTSNNNGQQNRGSRDQVAIYSLTVKEGLGPVIANGRLATIGIDTSGLESGSFDLIVGGISGSGLAGVEFLDAAGNVYSANLVNGTLNLSAVPEPAETLLVVALSCLFHVLLRRVQSKSGYRA